MTRHRSRLSFSRAGVSRLAGAVHNQVERWFALLTDRQLRRGVHKSLQSLEKDIRTWIQNWNENPQPFVWTKTADQILDRLSSYIERIPGAGH
jgi:hypothetical protein